MKTQTSADAEPTLCEFGHDHSKGELHSCPYQTEINDSTDQEFCTCCDECQSECRDAI